MRAVAKKVKKDRRCTVEMPGGGVGGPLAAESEGKEAVPHRVRGTLAGTGLLMRGAAHSQPSLPVPTRVLHSLMPSWSAGFHLFQSLLSKVLFPVHPSLGGGVSCPSGS